MLVAGIYLPLPSIGLLNMNNVSTRFLAKLHATSVSIEQLFPERYRLPHCLNSGFLPKAFINLGVLCLLRTSPLQTLLKILSSSPPCPLSAIISHIQLIVIVEGNVEGVVQAIDGPSTTDGRVNRIVGISTQRNLFQSTTPGWHFSDSPWPPGHIAEFLTSHVPQLLLPHVTLLSFPHLSMAAGSWHICPI